MTIVEDLRGDMSLREISRVSGISLSSFYYQGKERRVKRLSPQIEQDTINTASGRLTYDHSIIWAIIRNNNLSLPYAGTREEQNTGIYSVPQDLISCGKLESHTFQRSKG